MPNQPIPPTLSEVVRRAAEVVDPQGVDGPVTTLLERFEDRDEPVTAVEDVGQELEEALEAIDPAPTEPAVVMAAAVATYLAHRNDEMTDDREALLRLASRAEFDDQPPPDVAAWLAREGVRA